MAEEAKPVTQEDLNQFRSIYDTRIAELVQELKAAKETGVEFQTEIALLKKDLPTDKVKVLEQEREFQRRRAELEVRGKTLGELAHKLAAAQIAHKAETTWGVKIEVAELEKLGSEGEMAIAVMNKATAVKTGKKPPISSRPGQTSTPALNTVSESLTSAVKEFLNKEFPGANI